MSNSIISRDTLIPISAVLIVLSAGFSYGIMYQKVATLTFEVNALRQDVQQLSANVNKLLGIKSISYER